MKIIIKYAGRRRKDMDKMTIELFSASNKLVCDEKIVYASKKMIYSDEYDDYVPYYRVVTVNERTGDVRKYINMGIIVQGETWYSTLMH